MSIISENNKRIAQNTLLLYFRMFLMMTVSLYTSRIVLQKLGMNDFGLYNIIGGIVVFFSILNASLAGSTQRFLNYEIGKGNTTGVNEVFQCSISLHFILCGIILILSESIGIWYINNIMNMPYGRLEAANYVFQFSVITFCINIIRVPFNACIIAYEKMSFYAYISIIEALLKLTVAFLITTTKFDHLIFYSFLIMTVTIFVNLSYTSYCKNKFHDIKFDFSWNKNRIKSMMTFSGWSLFGSTAVISAQHGINLILNYFCGVYLNAAIGIANQVTSAMYGFISNFQTAFNPQIVKLYAQKQYNEFFRLVFRASKISYLLFWTISVPVLYATPTILSLWLDQVPSHAVSFIRVIIIFLLIDALNGPLWTSVNATGKIRTYQILMSIIILCNLPVVIWMLNSGYAPETVWMSKVFFNIVTMVARITCLKKLINFSIRRYIFNVLVPLSLVTIFSILCMTFIYSVHKQNTMAQAFIGMFSLTVATAFISLFFGLTTKERKFITNLIRNKIFK